MEEEYTMAEGEKEGKGEKMKWKMTIMNTGTRKSGEICGVNNSGSEE